MGLKDIVGKLDRVLDTKKGRAAKQADAIDELVEKLVAKEAKYIARLELAETDRDREKLERKIKVCRAQIAKGRAAITELRTDTA
ncbi:MAG: hypothetical protein KAT26_03045 [Marinosulfonomonas sp.]|nr:hypothetical protein [Marinosulfonomonas sp.]